MGMAGYAIYKRCVPGDRLKVEGRAQTSGTGGGAKDIRFNPLPMFETVFQKVFSTSRTEPKGAQVNSGPVYWSENGATQGPTEMEIWAPAKGAKRGEMRIASIPEVIPFDKDHIPPQDLDPFFLIWTDTDEDRVWARYTTIGELRIPGWAPGLVTPILNSVERVAPDQNIRGWINLRTGEGEHRDASR
jgi:hypothetical protein